MELVIEGNIFFEGRVQKLALGIEDGVIAGVRKLIRGVRSLDFGDKLILPGAIDAHVHFREPGMTHQEDFLSGTTAALCGGVTTVLDMPNTRPSCATLEDMEQKLAVASRKACTDFGLFAGLTGRGHPERMAQLAVGYKLYMGSTTGDLLVDDYERLPEILGPLPATGKPVAVHAEDEGILRSVKLRPKDPLSYDDARPPECEAGAVQKFLEALGGNRGHVCHVSTSGALRLIGAFSGSAGGRAGERGAKGAANGKEMKGESVPKKVTCEVTPHHLLLDAREDNALGAMGKMNPPLRKRPEREALWRAFLDGRIDALASDHAPHLEEEKDTDFAEAPAGVPGTETMVPLMMMLVKGGGLGIGRLVEACCTRPAEIYALDAGRIGMGMPAHLAVYDLHGARPIRGKSLHSKCAWSPFEGREAIFPKAVFIGGEQLVEDWEPVVTAGAGKHRTGRAR